MPTSLAPLMAPFLLSVSRVRTEEKFSSRTLDLDLLLYDQQIISNNTLNIPHDDILNYAFVLEVRQICIVIPQERKKYYAPD
jgi:2-amino-4-hydroxy-6-hydroxymethyldihydropteridine diphosphokinase